jgi:putative methionine-R-sulfoxide reductase with GAF domain
MLAGFLAILNAGDEALSDIFRGHAQEESQQYKSFAGKVRRILKAESCAVFLVRRDDDHRILELVSEDTDSGYRYPNPVKLPIQSTPRGGLTSHLAHSGRIIRLSGKALRESPYLRGDTALHLKSHVDYSLMSFPLKNRKSQLLGIVKVQNKKGKNGRAGPGIRFTDNDVSLAAFLSSRLAVPIEGREFVRFLKALLDRSPNPNDLSSFQSKVLTEALNLVGAERGHLAIWDERKKALIVTAKVGIGDRPLGSRVPSRSVMHSVWKRKEAIPVPDVRKYDGPYFPTNPATRSEIAVLVSTRDSSGNLRRVGVLNAESSLVGNFDLQDQEMLEGAGQSVAAAIVSAQPELSLRNALASLSTPSRVFVERRKLLSNILECVRDTYGFDRGVIYVADEMANLLRLEAQIGCPDQEHLVGKYSHEKNKKSLAAAAWQTGAFVYSPQPKKDGRVFQADLDRFKISGPMLGLPLIHSGKTLGVLLCWSFNGMPPRPEHESQLAPFAHLAAAELAIWDAYNLLDEWIHNIAQPSQSVRGLVRSIGQAYDFGSKHDFTVLKSQVHYMTDLLVRSNLMRQHQRFPPKRELYCLVDLVRNAETALRSQADELGVELRAEIPDYRCPVRGDEGRVRTALDELVVNAMKHSRIGGTVTIRLLKLTDPWYKILVIDQGHGIPKGYEDQIFNPYFSLRPGGGRAGTGLGLTIAFGIMKEEGGHLRHVPNEVDGGSVFALELPVEDSK